MANNCEGNEDQFFQATLKLIECFQGLVENKVPLQATPEKYVPYLKYSALQRVSETRYPTPTNDEYLNKFGRHTESERFGLNPDEMIALDGFIHAKYAHDELLKLQDSGLSEILQRLVYSLFFSGICNGVVGGSDIVDQFKSEAEVLRPDAEKGQKFNRKSGGTRQGRVSCRIEKHFDLLFKRGGVLPRTREVFETIPKDEYIGSKVCDDNGTPESIWIVNQPNKQHHMITYKSFEKRVGKIRKKYKK